MKKYIIETPEDAVKALNEILETFTTIIQQEKKENCRKEEKRSEKCNLHFYVDKFAKRLNWPFNKACNYLQKLYDVMPSAALSIVLKEIAIDLDEKYEDHISKSKEIWVISVLDGEIHKIDKKSVKNYKHFSAFRSFEDAAFAACAVMPMLNNMFLNEHSK